MKAASLLLLFLACRVMAEELPLDYPNQSGWKDLSVPDGAVLELALPESAMIGEQIPARLVIRNQGASTFEITTGGDYRATGFPQRLKVRVRDSTGNALPELTRRHYGMGGGGLMGGKTLQPGMSTEIEFPLERYVSFPKAGTYTVVAGHDLGWKQDKNRPHPLAKASIAVTEPTPEQAAGLVKSIVAGSQKTPTPIAFQGVSYPPEQDDRPHPVIQAKFNVLRHPLYLPALTDAAQGGSAEAVSGIGHITGKDATNALISLLKHDHVRMVSEALHQLLRRVPDKADPSLEAVGSMWGGSTFQIDPLLPASWDKRHEPLIAAELCRLLESENASLVSAAASMIRCMDAEGAPEAVLKALQRFLDASRPIPRHETAALYPVLPEAALLQALDALRKRGWRAPQAGGTASLVARFMELSDESIPKPEGEEWKSSMLTWTEHGPVTLKEQALRALPRPLSADAIKAVLQALDDDSPRVLIAACEAAEKSALRDFVPALCQLIETESVERVHDAAIRAATACGGRLELWRSVAVTIVADKMLTNSVRALTAGMLDLPLGGGSSSNSNFSREQRFQIRDAWLEFIEQHRVALAEGKKLPPPDDATSARLAGANFYARSPAVLFHLKTGGTWPASAK